jgi:hypothetical protein
LNDIEFWVVENNSNSSKHIQEYFKGTGKIRRYFYFKENITCNAIKRIITEFKTEIEEFDFFTMTDCDLLVDNAEEAFNEIRKNAAFEEVAFSCIDLKMKNFPHNIPGSWEWLPPVIGQTEEYIECPTGAHLMTIRKGMLDFMLDVPHMTDALMWQNAYLRNKKWVKTINNKAYHLTWDLYTPDNLYFKEKAAMTHESWYHDKMCEYVEVI